MITAYGIAMPQNFGDAEIRLGSTAAALGVELRMVAAVDGSALDPESPLIQRFLDINERTAFGQAGCLLSHRKVVHRMLDADVWPAVVLEEDAVTSHSTPAMALEDALSQCVGLDAEVLLLGGRIPARYEIEWVAPNLVRCTNPTLMTHAMVFWRSGAEAFASELERPDHHVDHVTGRVFARGRSFLRLPQLVLQDRGFRSVITGRRGGSEKQGRFDPTLGRDIDEFTWRQFLT